MTDRVGGSSEDGCDNCCDVGEKTAGTWDDDPQAVGCVCMCGGMRDCCSVTRGRTDDTLVNRASVPRKFTASALHVG